MKMGIYGNEMKDDTHNKHPVEDEEKAKNKTNRTERRICCNRKRFWTIMHRSNHSIRNQYSSSSFRLQFITILMPIIRLFVRRGFLHQDLPFVVEASKFLKG
jgi:hypothetical protein